MSSSGLSFISEHTVEYYLVPALKSILLKRYQTVIPMFPWFSREGSNISLEIHSDTKFKLVGLYPRRPKLVSRNQSTIKVKFNLQISIAAKKGYSLGIPMLAGVPFARNFLELGNSDNYFWFKLGIYENNDYEIDINNKGSLLENNSLAEMVIKDQEDLLSFVDGNTEVMRWNDAIEAMKQIKSHSEGAEYNRHFFFANAYKPVYFVLPEIT